MDFKTVLELILKGFNKENVRYGLIGGFALGVLGVPRSTVDLDFLIHRDDLDKVDKIMKGNGYKCVYKSENVSQYVSDAKVFGEVDFLHAFRRASSGMLDRVKELEVFAGSMKLRVLRPEDIIGLKVQAAVNDQTKANKEYADIEALMDYYRMDLNWQLIEDYFSTFSLEEKFIKLKNKYCNVE